jgi:hypothetical protein
MKYVWTERQDTENFELVTIREKRRDANVARVRSLEGEIQVGMSYSVRCEDREKDTREIWSR